MIIRYLWVENRKRKALEERYPGVRDTWRVTRTGWYLFGFIPLYVTDLSVEK